MLIYHFLTFSSPFTSKAKFRILLISGSQCIVGAQTKGLSHHGDPSILELWRWSADRHGSGSWQTAGGSQGQPDLYPAGTWSIQSDLTQPLILAHSGNPLLHLHIPHWTGLSVGDHPVTAQRSDHGIVYMGCRNPGAALDMNGEWIY